MLSPTLGLLALLACAPAVPAKGPAARPAVYGLQSRTLDAVRAAMCHYEGRHYAEGAVVPVRSPCLRCQCGRGAVSCRRRACASPATTPAPIAPCPHDRSPEDCCPHLHCSDLTDIVEGVSDTSTKYEEVYPEVVKSLTNEHPVCSEGGTVYAAGSAMGSATACEQCFCLGGVRRCVRPQCLRPPLGCRARPAPGVCCPQRYYCDHPTTKPPEEHHLHDCEVEGQLVPEGERVAAPGGAACSHCFCLRGTVRCQALACAPPLLGCRPLLEAGQCCPHQYQCIFQQRRGLPEFQAQPILDNTLNSFQSKDRSFRSAPPTAQYNVTTASLSPVTDKTTTSLMVDRNHSTATTKVKRKTSDASIQTTSKTIEGSTMTTVMATAPTTPKSVAGTDRATSTAAEVSIPEEDATEQPESSLKIIINGTINCTAELSTATVMINSTKEMQKYYDMENTEARIPNIASVLQNFETHTYNPNDIITDRNYNEDFDDNESYIINVTSSLISSLRSNSTLTSTAPSAIRATSASAGDADVSHNNSKKSNEYEYYINKPTLPPSLPNLKIIPFVAADAVVDDDTSPKKSHAYPIVDRHDKYPVFYPSGQGKDAPFATRREDLYSPTQFPIFLTKKVESVQYPISAHEVVLTNEYPNNGDIITSLQEYSVTAALGEDLPRANRATTKLPGHNVKFELETPVGNLFSPPAETEGGFVPKDPAMVDDFYALYTSTPAGAPLPHLTTSMQLHSKECVSEDGQRMVEGEAISIACSVCTCAWGELQCAARPCPGVPGCSRRPAAASAHDLCCGDLICNSENKITPSPQFVSTRSVPVTLPVNKSQEVPANGSDSFTELRILDNTTPKSSTLKSPALPTNEERLKSEVTNISLEQGSIENNEQSSISTTVAEDSEKDSDSQEYEDDSDDEGFSLGSVLKLLLSDSYATTTATPLKPSTVQITRVSNVVTKTTQPPTTRRHPPKASASVATVTNRPPYVPVKHQHQNAINRIDHLILGESTAIKKMNPRPATVPFKPIPTRKPAPTKMSTPETPLMTSKPVEVTKEIDYVQYTSVLKENVKPSTSHNVGPSPGFLKLAGCNIYGKMYRVERIIAELSSACQECRCTELGVQCRQLACARAAG